MLRLHLHGRRQQESGGRGDEMRSYPAIRDQARTIKVVCVAQVHEPNRRTWGGWTDSEALHFRGEGRGTGAREAALTSDAPGIANEVRWLGQDL